MIVRAQPEYEVIWAYSSAEEKSYAGKEGCRWVTRGGFLTCRWHVYMGTGITELMMSKNKHIISVNAGSTVFLIASDWTLHCYEYLYFDEFRVTSDATYVQLQPSLGNALSETA